MAVGRDRELAAVAAFVDHGAPGGAALVFKGEPGIGKTTVLAAALERAAAHGFRSMQVHGGTAMGDGIRLAVDTARAPVPDGLGGSRRLPAAIVMLSDGASTRGADPIDVVQQVKKYRIPIYTVALGTRNGQLKHVNKRTGAVTYERVPPDPLTLQEVSRESGGEFFAAPNAQKLSAVYRNLSTRLAHFKEKRQVTSAFAGGALVLLLAGAGFGIARGGRLP
jgi:Ca-activated chloride channel homolog